MFREYPTSVWGKLTLIRGNQHKSVVSPSLWFGWSALSTTTCQAVCLLASKYTTLPNATLSLRPIPPGLLQANRLPEDSLIQPHDNITASDKVGRGDVGTDHIRWGVGWRPGGGPGKG